MNLGIKQFGKWVMGKIGAADILMGELNVDVNMRICVSCHLAVMRHALMPFRPRRHAHPLPVIIHRQS